MEFDGMKIWISGAIDHSIDDISKANIECFIYDLTCKIILNRGHIIHGSHPTITPIIIRAAQSFNNCIDTKRFITFVACRYFSNLYESNVEGWKRYVSFHETPTIRDAINQRDASLAVMRLYLAERSDAFIAIGGKFWDNFPSRAGVSEEAKLAMEKKIPCFILGGFGGKASDLAMTISQEHHELKNGLNADDNKKLSECSDPAYCVNSISEQLQRLPFKSNSISKSNAGTFRILCLDGGGIKGTYAASFLKGVEQQLGFKICDHFDLIAGTSTGGIIALALAKGLSAEEILKFYVEKGPQIFPTTRLFKKWMQNICQIFRAKHSQQQLRDALISVFGSGEKKTCLNDLRRKVVIPTFQAMNGKSVLFRTPHCMEGMLRKDTDLVDVAIATAAAPLYFPRAVVKSKYHSSEYIDGGIWANTPTLVAIVESVKQLNIPINKIDVLSIGTTEEAESFTNSSGGLASWIKRIAKLILHAQQDSTITLSKFLVGETKLLRVNCHVPNGKYSLDNAKEIDSLVELGIQDAENSEILMQISSRFLNGIEVSPFVEE